MHRFSVAPPEPRNQSGAFFYKHAALPKLNQWNYASGVLPTVICGYGRFMACEKMD
jgi:hypothetical protein